MLTSSNVKKAVTKLLNCTNSEYNRYGLPLFKSGHISAGNNDLMSTKGDHRSSFLTLFDIAVLRDTGYYKEVIDYS